MLRGFGENEQSKNDSSKDEEKEDDGKKGDEKVLTEVEKLHKAIAQDMLIAIDRDMNGRLNFNEYMLLRKSVIAWL